MKIWQKYISHIWEIKLKKYHSELNGDLFVNLEYGKKVLHTNEANYSFQNLHKVLRSAIESVVQKLPADGIVLNLGMGGGSAVEILREELGFEGKIISVEHDPVIVEIAKLDFDIGRFSNHEIIVDDATNYIRNKNKNEIKFDLIICDLFKDKNVPEKFRTNSFFEAMLSQLKNKGHLIFNFILTKDQPSFFDDFIDKESREYSYFILKPTKDNHVLVFTRN